ncbi:MAG TPA: adenylate/guanylate cyclase domain-containing protein [Kofleriaceae bacterium]|nr:adenylate/guanylate cyclase domain-containing protein [Kofleriaceae bacterium]
MTRRARNVPLWTAIGATAVAAVLALVGARQIARLPGLAELEGLTIDARFRLRGPRAPATDRIVIVGMDDQLRAEAPDVLQTRRGYARLIDAISAGRPKLVALDLFFSTPEEILPPELTARVRAADAQLAGTADPALAEPRAVIAAVAEELRGDERLAQAIARSGRVMLGANFVRGPPGRGAQAMSEPPGLARARLGEVADAGGGDPNLRPIRAATVRFSLPAIAAAALGAGAINDLRDYDGVRRRMPLVLEHGGRHYMTLGLAVALHELGQPRATRYVAGARTLWAAGRELPLSAAASLPIDVLGRDRIPRVSAADVLADRAGARAQLAGKLVFVGHTYAAADKVATPLDLTADGVELHATVAENLLGGRVLRDPGWLATLAATLVLGGVVCAAQLRRVRRRAWVPPLVALVALAGYVGIALALFAGGTVIALALPTVLTGAVVLAATIGGLATEGREKLHLRALFSQYVSQPVVDRILADPARARLGGERKELTVLFTDIRGFSQVAEGMAPEELAAFLGEYLTPMTDLVLASGGTLDKYIGDAVMAFWGAPIDMPDHAARACEVALQMQRALATLNRAWAQAGRPPIAIGIGINTGPMAVGNMGSAARFEYTVLGDQVNLASRLEALTKEYGLGILVGEATARAAGAGFVFREIDLVRVKGRAGAAPVFELIGAAPADDAPAFSRALALYRDRKFGEAKAAFAALSGDPAAAVMAARCEVLAAAPPPPGWDGVYDQRSK